MTKYVQRLASWCGLFNMLCSFEKCNVLSFTVPVPTTLSTPGWLSERNSLVRTDSTQAILLSALSSTSSSNVITDNNTPGLNSWERQISKLKKVLQREYVSFFDPMETQYYDENVRFTDPLNDLGGVKAYQNNVDMLSGRTLLGKLLFSDAYIQLHSVTGGQVTIDDDPNVHIQDIVTRWTLGFTFSILPWKPSPRFTGISIYKVRADPDCVKIVSQTDYWDSINLDSASGEYRAVDRNQAVSCFLSLLSPQTTVGPATAGPELPYEVLRIADTYEIRRYPAYVALQIEYQRRDEAFAELGSYTAMGNIQPLAPAIVEITTTIPDEQSISPPQQQKTMHWPLRFAMPGDTTPLMSILPASFVNQIQTTSGVEFLEVPSTVVAIQRFSGPIVERTVQNIREQLCASLRNHRLPIRTEFGAASSSVTGEQKLQFAQYDAIFSVGQRRSEVRIPLSDTEEHPWSGNGTI